MSNQEEAQPQYLSYLVRLWHTHSGGAPVWRASLENPLTQEVLRFDGLPGLAAFLWAQTGQELPGNSRAWDAPPPTCSRTENEGRAK